MARNRTPKIKSVGGKAGKVVTEKVHPLILAYLQEKGIPVQKVEVDKTGEHVIIYNSAFEESK